MSPSPFAPPFSQRRKDRTIPFTWSVLAFGLLLFGCAETPPVEVETPGEEPPPVEETPFVEYRSWSRPQAIEAIPLPLGRLAANPNAFVADHEGNLLLLVQVPVDSLLPPQRLRLGYLRYDGARWSLEGEVEGDGWFLPASIIADDGVVQFFWGGVPPERRQDWLDRKVHATDLFHCTWRSGACSTPTSLATVAPFDRRLSFPEAVRDTRGNVHLVVDLGGTITKHYTVDAGGAPLREEVVGLHSEMRLLAEGDTLHMIYMAAPIRGTGGANDLFYQAFRDGVWSRPVVVYHDVDRLAQWPALALDAEGTLHSVFHSDGSTSGSKTLMYTFSKDRGRTWAAAEAVFTYPNSFFKPPIMAFDEHNVLHVTWSHLGSIRSDSLGFNFDFFYAARREGRWSEAQPLFPEFERISPPMTAIDENETVHLVFKALDAGKEIVYHAKFE